MQHTKKRYGLLAAGTLLGIGILVAGCASAHAAQVASTTTAPSPRALHRVIGTVNSISGQTLSVTTTANKQETVDLYPKTRVLDAQAATLSAIQPGATVRVLVARPIRPQATPRSSATTATGNASSSTASSSATSTAASHATPLTPPTALAVVLVPAPTHAPVNDHDADNPVRHPHAHARYAMLSGTVQAVNSQTLTIKTWAGTTTTVTLSSQTYYIKVVPSTTSAIVPNKQFGARGSYDSSGHFWAWLIALNDTGQNLSAAGLSFSQIGLS